LSLAAQGRSSRSQADRERLLAKAAADFEAFAKGQPASEAALDALRQSANLYAEQALSLLSAGKKLPDQATAQQKDAQLRARESFAKAINVTQQIVDACTKELAALPKPTAIQADAEAKARRDLLRNRHVEAKFLLARLAFEQAAAYDAKSDDHSKALEDASRQFGELVEEYRENSLVGATSRFYQGRCAQEMGAYEKALDCYQDLVRAPTADAEFRRWTARAHRRRAECLAAIDKRDDAIADCEDWIISSSPAERKRPEWLEVQYRLAEGYQVRLKEGVEDAGDEKQLQTKVRNLLRDVSEHSNEFQQDAKLALASLGQRATAGGEVAEYKGFEEAFAAGKTSLELWNSSMLAAKLARENNPEAEEELKSEADDHRNQALQTLETALDLADRQTPIDQLNAARYYVCVLYWEDKRIHEAAVLAEFLAKRYPESEYAASAAKVALAAYEQAGIEARADGNGAADASSYETGKLAELAELVALRWPESAEASSAVNVLIQTALRENRLADAEALLARLPAESRGAAELSLGAGLWTQYLRSAASERETPTDATIALRDKAGGLLTQGFASLKEGGKVTQSAAVGSLYLVQYLLAKGDAVGALEALEHKTAGALSLVEAQDKAAARPDFVLETYKTALRTYLSAEPPQRENAEGMMSALDEFVSAQGGDQAAQKLTEVYLGLGVQLQRHLKDLSTYGQKEKAAQVAAAFGDVLDRVAARPDADTWRIRNWLAQTNLQLGQALTGKESLAYVKRAQKAYEDILAAAAKDKSYAPDAMALLGVRMQLGECLAALGEHQKAIEQYGAILKEKPNTLDLQLSAATALQKWGVAKKDLGAFDRSIRGDLRQKDGKNLIWGWLKLATMANSAKRQAADASSPGSQERAARFEDLFFEARYNVAKSRYLAGTIAPAASRQDHLKAARANIDHMKTLYPEMGAPKWKAAFDELSKQIDQELAK
jgi:hypothetical protein